MQSAIKFNKKRTGLFTVAAGYSRYKGIYFILLTLLTGAVAQQAYAQTNTWVGSVDSDWHKPCNWSLNTVPTCNDDVVVPNSAIYPVITALGECHTLSITSTTANAVTLNSSGGGTLYESSTNGGTCPGNPTINAAPSAPVPGTITQPSCSVSTGSVALSGLPGGQWTITGMPSGSWSGNGSTSIITGLAAGTYTFTVSNGACSSASSTSAVINPAPTVPTAPTATITQPTCTSSTGTITIDVQSAVNYSIDGISYQASNVFAGLSPGTYSIYVQSTSIGNCVASTANQVVNNPLSGVTAPVINTITQPTCTVATGSVALSGLPSTGTWTVTGSPSGTLTGSGTTGTVTGLTANTTYTFTVAVGSCTSTPSASAVINAQPSGTSGSQTFNYTGGVQTFTVSSNACATTLSIDMRGAAGGASAHYLNPGVDTSSGGLGGRVQCTSCITVTPGQVIDVYVGGRGTSGVTPNGNTAIAGLGGYNGGGKGGAIGIFFAGGGGGGASDIRTSGGGLPNRLAVAGGGGGAGIYSGGTNTDDGGAGGGTTGGTGYAGGSQAHTECGQGGTQSAGGTPGNDGSGYGACSAAYGTSGNGGRACEGTDTGCPSGTSTPCNDDPAGGGGGGYFGGGAGSNGGAGGGSNYAPGTPTHTQGYQAREGQIIISWP